MAKMILALILFAAAVMECAPVENAMVGATELNEMVIPAIGAAVMPLQTVLDDERAEVAEMADIKKTIDGFPDKQMAAQTTSQEQDLLQAASQRIELDTDKAMKNEDLQQEAALKSLTQVNALIHGFKDHGVQAKKTSAKLGEGMGESPMGEVQHALQELEEVSAELTSDTSTMTTKAKIEGMRKEAEELVSESSSVRSSSAPDESQVARYPDVDGYPGVPKENQEEAGLTPDGFDPLQMASTMQHDPNGPGPPVLGEAGAGSDMQQAAQEIQEEADHPPDGESQMARFPDGYPVDSEGDPTDMAHLAKENPEEAAQMAGYPTGNQGGDTDMEHQATVALMEKEQIQVGELYKAEADVEKSEGNNEDEVQKLMKQLS